MKLVFLTDFDGTVAQTFQSPPGGVGVIEAYELAIESVFGSDGLALYHQQGGLAMRAPGETVSLLLAANARLSDRARQWHEKGGWKLFDSLVPEGLGATVDWENESSKAAAECLVVCKLNTLVRQIGTAVDSTVWPALCAGFGTFWPWLHNWSEENGLGLVAGVITSGHHTFVEETFVLHTLLRPVLLVTNDHTRAQPWSRQSRLNKPHPELFDLVNQVWLSEGADRQPLPAERTMFAGDDDRSDIGLAKGIGALPLHFVPGTQWVTFCDDRVVFGDWRRLATWLERRTTRLQDGVPITDLAGAP